jgi:hypothetical protein
MFRINCIPSINIRLTWETRYMTWLFKFHFQSRLKSWSKYQTCKDILMFQCLSFICAYDLITNIFPYFSTASRLLHDWVHRLCTGSRIYYSLLQHYSPGKTKFRLEKYGLHCAYFHKIDNHAIQFFGHLLRRIWSNSDEERSKYKQNPVSNLSKQRMAFTLPVFIKGITWKLRS